VYLDPLALANAINEKAGENLPQTTIRQLAWALANGRGVAMNGDDVYVVLGDPLAGDDVLTITRGRRGHGRKSGRLRPGPKVMDAFRLLCGDFQLGPMPDGRLWIPAIEGAAARATVGGDLPHPQQRAANGYTINWYLMRDIQFGGLFYYYRYADCYLAVYQQVAQTYALLAIYDPQNIVVMSEVVDGLANGEEVEGIAPLEGSPTLMHPTWAS